MTTTADAARATGTAAAALARDAITVLTNLSGRAEHAVTRTLAAGASDRVAATAIGTRHGAEVHHACWRHLAVVADLIGGTSRAILHARAVLANFARAALLVGT